MAPLPVHSATQPPAGATAPHPRATSAPAPHASGRTACGRRARGCARGVDARGAESLRARRCTTSASGTSTTRSRTTARCSNRTTRAPRCTTTSGCCTWIAGSWTMRCEQFQRAIAIDPRHVTAHNNLGVAFMRLEPTRRRGRRIPRRAGRRAPQRRVDGEPGARAEGRGPHRRRARPAPARASRSIRATPDRITTSPCVADESGDHGGRRRALPRVPAVRRRHPRRSRRAVRARLAALAARIAARSAQSGADGSKIPAMPDSKHAEFDDLLREDRTFSPPPKFQARARRVATNASTPKRREIPKRSGRGLAGELEWSRPWTTGPRLAAAACEVVRRRPTERQRQLPGPPRARPAPQQGRDHLGRRARAIAGRSRTSSCIAQVSTFANVLKSLGVAEGRSRRASTCRSFPSWRSRCSPARASAPCTASCSAASAPSRCAIASTTRRRACSSPPTAAIAAADRRRSRRSPTRR